MLTIRLGTTMTFRGGRPSSQRATCGNCKRGALDRAAFGVARKFERAAQLAVDLDRDRHLLLARQFRIGDRPGLLGKQPAAARASATSLRPDAASSAPSAAPRSRAPRAAPRRPGFVCRLPLRQLLDRVGQFANARDGAVEAEFVEIVGDRGDRLVDRAAQRRRGRRQSGAGIGVPGGGSGTGGSLTSRHSRLT